MHKGIIFLTKTESREEALNNVEYFLEGYGSGLYDWYTIGGRWHNTLAPEYLVQQFANWLKTEYAHVFKEHGYAIKDLENETDRPIIQKKWEELGLKGKNPFYSANGFEVTDTKDDYNVVPLSKCIETVQKWLRNLDTAKEKAWEDMKKARRKAKTTDIDMSYYYAREYYETSPTSISFDTNVFNITENEGEKIPSNIKNYWAVMIDLHN